MDIEMADNIQAMTSEAEYGIDDLRGLAKVAEAAERYNDMIHFMSELVTKKSEKNEQLDLEERNLLSVAYKNVVGSKRSSWRTLTGGTFAGVGHDAVTKYLKVVEKELEDSCKEVLSILEEKLLPNCTVGAGSEDNPEVETEVFYRKMCGDYYRYMSEFLKEQGYEGKTEEFYKKAMEVASALPETHPTKLGLALNFSVCYYEILKKPEKACQLAKEAFDAAIEKLDKLSDTTYKDSTLIMQLLRDNLTLWSSEADEEEETKHA